MPILKGLKQKSQVLFTKCPTEGSITKYFYSIFYYMVKNIIFFKWDNYQETFKIIFSFSDKNSSCTVLVLCIYKK